MKIVSDKYKEMRYSLINRGYEDEDFRISIGDYDIVIYEYASMDGCGYVFKEENLNVPIRKFKGCPLDLDETEKLYTMLHKYNRLDTKDHKLKQEIDDYINSFVY